MNFLAIDIGTTTMKAGVFNLQGDMLAYASQEGQLVSNPGQDFYWQNTKQAIVKCLDKLEASSKSQIRAMSISSHTDTLFSLDRNGKDIIPVIPWLNQEGEQEKQEVMKNFNPQSMFSITGQPAPSNVFFGIRAYSLVKKHPRLVKRVWKFMQVMDFILFKLTGKAVGEPTVYDGSYLFDINNHRYYEPLLEFMGMDKNQLPDIVPSGTNLGNLKEEVAGSLGLPSGIQVIVGAMDQNCSSLGAGNIGQNMVTVTSGTVLAAMVNIDKPIFDQEVKMPVYNQIAEQSYCLLAWSPSGGLFLKWFKDNFFQSLKNRDAADNIYGYMDNLAQEIEAGSQGLITLPFIAGAMTPFNNDRAKGIFFGISLKHNIGHFIRSIMESNAFMLKLYLELFKKIGIAINEVRIIGGGSNSNLWNQITADVTKLTVRTVKNSQASLLGAAMIAAVGSGYYQDYSQAARSMVKTGKEYRPEHRLFEVYEYNYDKFLKIYKNNINIF